MPTPNKPNETSFHICSENNGTGPKYCGLHFKCSQCKKNTVIGCISKLKKIANFLTFFGIGEYDKVMNTNTKCAPEKNTDFRERRPCKSNVKW